MFGSSGNEGPALDAEIAAAIVTVGPRGDIYFDDLNAFRTVDTAGVIHAFAGTGVAGFSGDDGPAVEATIGLSDPVTLGVAADGAGNVYVGDPSNHRIRKVDSAGVITTVAGTGIAGQTGDHGPAVDATVDSPGQLAVDAAGDLFFTDTGSVRRIDAAGVITTVAGTGVARLLRRLRPRGGCTGGTLGGRGPRRDRLHRRRGQLPHPDDRAVDPPWNARLRRPRWWPAGVSESLALELVAGPSGMSALERRTLCRGLCCTSRAPGASHDEVLENANDNPAGVKGRMKPIGMPIDTSHPGGAQCWSYAACPGSGPQRCVSLSLCPSRRRTSMHRPFDSRGRYVRTSRLRPHDESVLRGSRRAAVLIATVAVIALSGGATTASAQSPSVPAAPSPSGVPIGAAPAEMASSGPIDTGSWASFTSTQHGFSLRHPADWTVRHATAPWVYGDPVDHDLPGDPATDELDLPDGAVFWLASLAIPASVGSEGWWAQYATTDGGDTPCWPPLSEWQPIAIGDLVGAWHGGHPLCHFTEAVVVVDGRAYAFAAGGGPNGVVDIDLFKAVLSTVVIDAGAAKDEPAPSPSAASSAG